MFHKNSSNFCPSKLNSTLPLLALASVSYLVAQSSVAHSVCLDFNKAKWKAGFFSIYCRMMYFVALHINIF